MKPLWTTRTSRQHVYRQLWSRYDESFHSYLHFYFKLLWNVLKQRGQWNSPWPRPRPHVSITLKLQTAKMPDWQMKSSQELQHFVAVGKEKLPIVDNRLLKIRIVPYWTNNEWSVIWNSLFFSAEKQTCLRLLWMKLFSFYKETGPMKDFRQLTWIHM